MTVDRRSVALGLRDGVPIAFAVVPFGAITGLAAVQAGLDKLQAIVMPYLVFAGASQLAAYQLIKVGAPVLVILATTTMINLRFTMYSASLSRYLGGVPRLWRFVVAFFTTDQGFVMAVHRFESDTPPRSVLGYLVASWMPMWFSWTSAAVAGALLGTVVPPAWHLDFAVPLVFLSLLAGALRGRPAALAASVAGALAVVLAGLPLNLGMMLGSLAGITVGTLSDGRERRRVAGEGGP
jgi:predicted branched-subunit amino acid permease